jgi:hypothetical protein
LSLCLCPVVNPNTRNVKVQTHTVPNTHTLTHAHTHSLPHTRSDPNTHTLTHVERTTNRAVTHTQTHVHKHCRVFEYHSSVCAGGRNILQHGQAIAQLAVVTCHLITAALKTYSDLQDGEARPSEIIRTFVCGVCGSE